MSGSALNEAVDVLARLVGFDTTSSRSNMDLIAFVRDYLQAHGIHAQLVGNDRGDKASLFATVGPHVAAGVVLSGHTDVVPVAGQEWRSDPFRLVAAGDRVHGRGTADMKGFIAAALAMVPHFLERRLQVPVHLAFSYDEEVGCLAAPALIARLMDQVPPPALAIVGEPSEMRVAHAHRGITTFVTSIRGRTGHSSAPRRGVNAISCAADCIVFLDRLSADMAAAWFRDNAVHAEGEAGPTTINVGTIEGGTAVNVIAEHCTFHWECRPTPGQRAADILAHFDDFATRVMLPRMRARAREAHIKSVDRVAVPPLQPRPGSWAERLALSFTGHETCSTLPFASEAGLFQAAGVPTVVCGPGSCAQAHQPNEYVSLDQLQACLAFMERLADWAANPCSANPLIAHGP